MAVRFKLQRIFWILGIVFSVVLFLFFLIDAFHRWGPLTFGDFGSVGRLTIAVNESQASTVSLSSSVISELTGEVTLDAAGLKVTSAGDVNGDSYDDFLVGTKTNDDTGVNAGAAYLVYGRSSPLTSEGLGGSSNTIVEFTGETASDYAGTIVGPAGDVDNDGYDDILITAYQPGPGVGNGFTYLIYGQAATFASNVSLGSSGIVKFTGEALNDAAGAMANSVGDVNGDGYDDFMIGATGNDDVASNAGAAYLIYGQAAHLTSANLSTAIEFTGEATVDGAGTNIASGDFNHDGYSDMLISSPTYGTNNLGRTYLFYGKSAAFTAISLGAADAIFTGEVAEDAAGIFVNSPGDVNNDSYDDILISSTANDDAGTSAGAVYLIYGQSSALSSSSLSTAIEFTGEATGDNAGNSVSGAGDLNNDGYDDFLIGAPLNDDTGTDAGAAYLIYGQASALTSVSLSTEVEFTGEAAGDRAGNGVSGGGDINNDGFKDIIISSRFNDDGFVDAGSTYVVYYQPPFASLSASTQALSEAAGSGTVTAQIANTFSSNVVVPFTTSGTATGGGVDYTFASGTITIPVGSLTGNVALSLVDDAMIEDGETIIVTLGAPSYGSLSGTTVQTITLTDNDVAGFTVSAISGNTTEAGGTATATVALTSQPSADVSFGLSSSNTAEGTVSPASLTFTSGNWSAPQTLTVTGIDDAGVDGDILYSITTDTVASADVHYTGLNPADIAVTNTDNDVAGVTVSSISGATTEAGGIATFTVVLNTQPVANVAFGMSSSNTGEGAISLSSLTFIAENWSTPQTVTVTGVDDVIDDGNIGFTVTLSPIVSDDGVYSGFNPSDVSVTNTDNDTSGMVFTESSGATTVTEGGGTDSYTVALASQPADSVSITLSHTTRQITFGPSVLTFTSTDWATPQTVTVGAIDDTQVEGSHSDTLVHTVSSTDSLYNVLSAVFEIVTVTDNDVQTFATIMTPIFSATPPVSLAPETPEVLEPSEPLPSPSVLSLPSSIAVNMLVKAPNDGNAFTQTDSQVYSIGTDGRRHVFPGSDVYFSWYPEFTSVVSTSLPDLSQVPLGSNVTFKPGVHLVKFQSLPRVYAVDRFGVLRWVTSENVARQLYGLSWNKNVKDISDAFFSNYTFGAYIMTAQDFDPQGFSSVIDPSDSMPL